MRIKTLLIMFVFLLTWANISFAAEFLATVNSTNIRQHDILELNLTVEDASPNHAPNFSALEKNFHIYSNSNFSNMSVINGAKSIVFGWKLGLVPISTGEVIIPALEIETSAGSLKSKPIVITVTKKETSQKKAENIDQKIKLQVNINQKTTYIHQPLVYTEKLMTKVLPLYNLHITDLKINDALVEPLGETKHNEIFNGEKVTVYGFDYRITPLTTGTIVIPPLRASGEIKVDNTKSYDPFGNFFAGSLLGQNNFKPFIINSEEITVNVQPAVGDKTTWLPLESLIIEDLSNIEITNKVGEPITRTLKISAIGGTAKTLPNLEKFNIADGVKLYTGQPVLSTNYDNINKKVNSSREETYTIIPEKPGTIILPEISVDWWDVNHDKMRSAILPAKEIQILPLSVAAEHDNQTNQNESIFKETNHSIEQIAGTEYIIISLFILVVILITIILYLIFGKSKKNIIEKKRNLGYSKLAYRINQINSLQELYKFIQDFAVENWQVPKNMSLKNIIIFLKQHQYGGDLHFLQDLFTNLNTAIYQNGNLDLYAIKKGLITELPNVKKIDKIKTTTFNSLNPT